MKIAIIEDDNVEQIVYKRLFHQTRFDIEIYTSFQDFITSTNSQVDFIISDNFVENEEVKDWLHIFNNIPGIIVSNARKNQAILNSGINILEKPISITTLEKQIELQMDKKSFFELLEKETRFSEFCDTKDEALEIIELLNNNLEQAIVDLEANSPSIEEKYFYHNLLNQVQYFNDNESQVQFLKKLEQQLYDGINASQEQHNELIRYLSAYSNTLKNIVQHELSNH